MSDYFINYLTWVKYLCTLNRVLNDITAYNSPLNSTKFEIHISGDRKKNADSDWYSVV
jgi:hypothetical protein